MDEKITTHNYDQSSTNGFDVPEDYFDKSRSQILAKVNQGGFKTPDAYFETSKSNILASIQPKQNKFHIKPYWYAAAAVALMVAGIVFYTNIKTSTPTFAQITDDEIIQYVAAVNLQDISLEMLATNSNFTTELNIQEEELIEDIDTEILLNEL